MKAYMLVSNPKKGGIYGGAKKECVSPLIYWNKYYARKNVMTWEKIVEVNIVFRKRKSKRRKK